MEEYKKIPTYENYGISKNGKVFNFKTGKILKPHISGKVAWVSLSQYGTSTIFKVSNLVYFTWTSTNIIPRYSDIKHLDGDNTNNNVNNLVYERVK